MIVEVRLSDGDDESKERIVQVISDHFRLITRYALPGKNDVWRLVVEVNDKVAEFEAALLSELRGEKALVEKDVMEVLRFTPDDIRSVYNRMIRLRHSGSSGGSNAEIAREFANIAARRMRVAFRGELLDLDIDSLAGALHKLIAHGAESDKIITTLNDQMFRWWREFNEEDE